MKKTIEQIKAEIAAYFAVREKRVEPLTPLQEEVKAHFADPKVSATTLRSDHKVVTEYIRETFSSREKALFLSITEPDAPGAEAEDEEFLLKILAHGNLRNDDEFRELLSIVDSLVQSGDGSSERVQKTNQLIAAYELSKSEKAR